MLALMLVGMFSPLWLALPALVLVTGFLSWLAVLSWPVLEAFGKLLRGLLVSLVAGAAIGRALGWL